MLPGGLTYNVSLGIHGTMLPFLLTTVLTSDPHPPLSFLICPPEIYSSVSTPQFETDIFI